MAEKPRIAEGEVACEGCGTSITRNQEKLSKLLTGKSLCKKCMNP
jgi:formylmethanofuran dehydrogenase subunit E